MKKIFFAILSLMTMIFFTACGETSENSSQQSKNSTEQKAAEQPASEQKKSNSKILVAFFSHTGENYQVGVIEKGNTHIMADMIAEITGADEFEIKTVNPYPKTYQECTEIAKKELEENARPELSTKVEDMSKYEVIFLGYPIWWSDFPPAVYTFLESYDFKGKTIIPFCTSAGEYMTGKEVNIPKIAAGSTIKDGIGLIGKDCQDNPDKIKESVKQWLTNLGY